MLYLRTYVRLRRIAQFLLQCEMFQSEVSEKIETCILWSELPPPHTPENRTVYEIMWANMVQSDRPQIRVWRMRIVCWMGKAADAQ